MVLGIIGIVTVVLPHRYDFIERPYRIILYRMLFAVFMLRVSLTAPVSVEDLSAVTPALKFIC